MEDKGKAAAEETKADEEEAEADTESSEVAADETAADTEQAEAAAEGAKAGEEEVDAAADEAAEVGLTFLPFVDVIADTVGAAAAVGLHAAAAADTAHASGLEAASVAERAAEADAQAELVKTKGAEVEAGATETRDSAAAEEAEETAEGEEADKARAEADEAAKEEDAAKQKASTAEEAADEEQLEALAARKFSELRGLAIRAAFFALLSLVLSMVPAVYLLGKWVASGVHTVRKSFEFVMQSFRGSGAPVSWASRWSIECLHGLTLALMASRLLLPVVASAVRELGQEELRLGNFKETHKSPAILLHNFEVLAPTIKLAIGDIVGGSYSVFYSIMVVEIAFMFERLRRTSMRLSRRLRWVAQSASEKACAASLTSAAASILVLSWSRSLCFLFKSAHAPPCSSICLVIELSTAAAFIVELQCRCRWAPPSEQEGGQPEVEPRGIAGFLAAMACGILGFPADVVLALLLSVIHFVEGCLTLSSGWMLCSLVMFALFVWKLALPYALAEVKVFVAQQWHWLLLFIVLLELVDLVYVSIRFRLWHRCEDRQGHQGIHEGLLPH